MVEARRAPAAVAGRVSSVDRFVYAIGGDDGDSSSAKSTIEVARVGVYGDLEAWTLLPDELPVTRTHAAAVIIDSFIYVVGGTQDGRAVNTTLRATILDPLEVDRAVGYRVYRSPEADTWSLLPHSLGEPRWQCSAYTVDARLHTVVAEDETWVYFAGGLSGGGASRDVQAGTLEPGGSLGSWQTISNLSPARAGFATASASDFLYAFGGHNGSPSSTGVSAELTTADLPDVRNWNSLSTQLSEARYLAGSAQESAVIFVLGGQTDADDASRTTDFTNF